MGILNFYNSAFGLDISNRSIKFLQLEKKGPHFKLAGFGAIELPPGIIEQGSILNPEILAKYLKKEFLTQKGRNFSKEVVASLPDAKAFLQVIQMPKMSQQELAQAVFFEAENYIPLSASEMCLDFEVIEPVQDNLDHIDVFLAAIPQKVVQDYLNVLEAVGLRPLAFETESRAIFRAVIPKETAFAPTLILDFGQTRTNFCITAGRALRLAGNIAFSGIMIDQKISKELKVDPEKAAQIRKRYGISDTFDAISKLRATETKECKIQFSSQIISGRKLAEILAPLTSSLVQEIRCYLDFYAEHPSHEHLPLTPSNRIGKIIITGGLANLKGLKEFLSKELGLEVQLANPWINIFPPPIKGPPELNLTQSQEYTTAIGLALRGTYEQ